MSANVGGELNLRSLISKLGHKLEEIRVRSLKNIISKLEHQLLSDADVVQEKVLHIRLLEWFNFSSCPNQEDVLSLILRLTRHASAAAIYIDIGAVDFLTQLRPNIHTDKHKLIDGILDNLFHLPTPQFDPRLKECFYKRNSDGVESYPVVPCHYLEASDSLLQELGDKDAPVDVFPSPAEPQVGYFTNDAPDDRPHYTLPAQIPSVNEPSSTCFTFTTFPWIPLTSTDKHVLSSTESSLGSRSPPMVVSACNFLSDVVLQDFPAEVFLQRPSIVKCLLPLLSVPNTDAHNVAMYSMITLKDLTKSLEARIRYCQDPNMYSPKQDIGSLTQAGYSSMSISNSLGSSSSHQSTVHSNERPSHLDDGIYANSSHTVVEDMEQLDIDEIHSLQFLQWTTPQFCANVLEQALPCLKTHDERLMLHGIQLLHQLLSLLEQSVSPTELWDDKSAPARELAEKLQGCVEMLSDVIYLHYHGNLNISTPSREISQHRLAFIGLAIFVTDLLRIFVPHEKASEVLPSDCDQMLSLLAHDESLAYNYGGVRETALEFLGQMDGDGFNMYLSAQQMCQSLHSTCSFLNEFSNLGDENVLLLLAYAEESLSSLLYHVSLQYIESCVQLSSYICKKSSPNPNAMKQSRLILIQLLAHPLDEVRSHAYWAVLSVIQDALGINQLGEPTSSTTQSAVFIIDEDILYEICCFGMNDKQEKVRTSSSNILLYLLQSQLLMPVARWQQLIEALIPIMPVLQGFAGIESSLGKVIIGLLDTERNTGALPILERFRGTLRLMFNSQSRMRSEGLGKLSWFLAFEENSLKKLPLFLELDTSNLADIFLVDSERSLVDEDTSRSVFTPDGLLKVYKIFTSENVDKSVKKSAAEQLAIILQDPALHVTFREQGGLEHVLSLLHALLIKPDPEAPIISKQRGPVPCPDLLPAIVKMIRSLVQHDSALRHKLAHDGPIYYAVVRARLLMQQLDDASSKQEATQLLALLLFDEVASTQPGSALNGEAVKPVYSLPSFVVKRYRLPFKPAVHHAISPHQCAAPSDQDPLRSGALAEMLRFSWNAAWYDGIGEAIQKSTPDEHTDANLFSKTLCPTRMDKVILETSYMPHALRQAVFDWENATSHEAVNQAVLRLCSHFVASGGVDISPIFQDLDWKEPMSRFFLVIPSSAADDCLLSDILQLVVLLLQCHHVKMTQWLGEALHNVKGALLGLLKQEDVRVEGVPESSSRRNLQRQLLLFVQHYVGTYPWSLSDRKTMECIHGSLSQVMLTRVSRADASQFYNLASLESTLLCLMHMTARPGWSADVEDNLSLCVAMLNRLLEVLCAFHTGRGGVAMSYMGCGVTRCAAICLRHLAFEMETQLQRADWYQHWLYPTPRNDDSEPKAGYDWLLPLFIYRDMEVRAAGLGIAVALSASEQARIILSHECRSLTGGVWGYALTRLLDHSESSIVRQQAALLLANLTSQPMPSTRVEDPTKVFQGPEVHNDETAVTLLGMKALLALLHHTRFYYEIMVLLSNYYPQPSIHPLPVAAGSKVTTAASSSQNTLTTPGSVSHSSNSRSTGNNTDMSDATLTKPMGTAENSNVLTPGTALGAHPQDSSTPSFQSTMSSVPEQFQSVSSPGLVVCVCDVLHNLLALSPQETLESIKEHGMHNVFVRIIGENFIDCYVTLMEAAPDMPGLVLSFRHSLVLHNKVLGLLTLLVKYDSDIKASLLDNQTAMRGIIKLLNVTSPDDADTTTACEGMWQAVMTFFSVLLQEGGQDALKLMTVTFVKHWHIFNDRWVAILQDRVEQETPLWLSVLHLIAVMLTIETQLQESGTVPSDEKYRVSERLDAVIQTESEDDYESSSGSSLCQVLLRAYDAVQMKPFEQFYDAKLAAVNALKAVLTMSESAKHTALEAGFVETICDNIRRLHLKLNMDALQLSSKQSPSAGKKRESAILSELVVMLNLLRNFMFNNTEIKLTSLECGLSTMIHKLWAWCQIDSQLMIAALHLLAVYTARCTQAASSLAFTSSMSTDDNIGRQQHSTNSLVHCLIRLLQKEMTGTNISLLKSIFAVLSNVTMSQECRGILWKSNFLVDFSKLNPSKANRPKIVKIIEGLWLNLMVNLSFSVEGQNLILKLKDILPILIEFGRNTSSDRNKKCATLILRNLCYHTPNKPKMLANDDILPLFVEQVEGNDKELNEIASCALLALVYNNQKAKVSLKNQAILMRLQDAYHQFADISETPSAAKCADRLQNLLLIVRS